MRTSTSSIGGSDTNCVCFVSTDLKTVVLMMKSLLTRGLLTSY